jgi:hypothetical protein
MIIKPPPISWPTRDNWTAPRQPRYPDGSIPLRPSSFATSAEIDNLIRALQQLHETQAGVARRRVTEAIKKLRNDTFPYVAEVPEAKRLLEPLHRRLQDAHNLLKQAWSQHRDDRPVDDAAWAAELQRRATIESEFAAAWADLESFPVSENASALRSDNGVAEILNEVETASSPVQS